LLNTSFSPGPSLTLSPLLFRSRLFKAFGSVSGSSTVGTVTTAPQIAITPNTHRQFTCAPPIKLPGTGPMVGAPWSMSEKRATQDERSAGGKRSASVPPKLEKTPAERRPERKRKASREDMDGASAAARENAGVESLQDRRGGEERGTHR
jgi:hypothetical protein